MRGRLNTQNISQENLNTYILILLEEKTKISFQRFGKNGLEKRNKIVRVFGVL